MSTRRILTNEQIAWAVDKRKLGYSWAAIARALYVCEMTVISSVKAVYGHCNFRGPVLPPLVYEEG